MDHFHYHQGLLHAEDLPIPQIAAAVGTPFYCYSTATLRRHVRVFREALAAVNPLVCFAVKANSNLAVLKTLAQEGCGADVVSEGEIRRALAATIPPEKIIFSGVGKTADEMRYALTANILQFNVESEPELRLLSTVATEMGLHARIAIRVNPDVDAGTHAKISTGQKESKFGVELSQARDLYQLATVLPGLQVQGISVHIGSQLVNLEPFRAAFTKLRAFIQELRAAGHRIDLIDLGGGFGISYGPEMPPELTAYAAIVQETMGDMQAQLAFEPGRVLVGNAGLLVSQVIYVKQGSQQRYVIVDAAMNDLIRPSMYDAHHEFITVQEKPQASEIADIVGPVCETGDSFAKARSIPPVEAGELVAFRSAGAYGAVMSGTYNTRPLLAEVLVDGNRFAVVRPRQTYEALLGQDHIPDWL